MAASDAVTELDKRIGAALQANACSAGAMSGFAERLYAVHNVFKAKRASGQWTDEQYAEKAREILELLGE